MNSYGSYHLDKTDVPDVRLCGHSGSGVTLTIGARGFAGGDVGIFFRSRDQLADFCTRCQQALQDYDSQAAEVKTTAAE